MRKLSHVLGCSLTLALLLAFFYRGIDGYLSQNAFYHLKFASLLSSGDWQYRANGFLSSSIFKDQFIDQHFGFHALVAVFRETFGPLFAIKMLTVVSLSVSLFFLGLTFASPGPFVVLSGFVFAVFLYFREFARIFWERPQPLNILFLSIFVYLVMQKPRAHPVFFVVALLAGLVSFESGIVVAGAALASWICFGDWRTLAYSVAGFALTLFMFPFGMEKIQYFVSLLTNNVFLEDEIREWQNSTTYSYQMIGLLISFFLSLLFSAQMKPSPERKRLFFFATCALGTLALYLSAQRFGYLFVFFSLLYALEWLKGARLPKQKYIVPALASLLLIVGVFQLWTHKKTFTGDRATIYSAEQFAAWFAMSPYASSRIVNFKWEYWSSLFYQDDRIHSEPGFSLMIYKNDPVRLKAYKTMRNRLRDLNLGDWRDLFNAFGSKHLLVDTRSPFLRLYKTNAWPFVPLYGDSQFAFLEFVDPATAFTEYDALAADAKSCIANESSCLKKFVRRQINPDQIDLLFPMSEESLNAHRLPLGNGLVSHHSQSTNQWTYAEHYFSGRPLSLPIPSRQYWTFPFYRRNGKWMLAPKNLLPVTADEFLKNLEGLYSRHLSKNDDIFYSLDSEPSAKQTTPSLGRKFLGILSICQRPTLSSQCKRLLKKYSSGPLDNLGLGTLSIYGLILHENPKFDEEGRLQKIADIIASHYDSKQNLWYSKAGQKGQILRGRNYMFSVGEALTLLAATRKFSELTWLRDELTRYSEIFLRERSVYYVRWLLSALYFATANNPEAVTHLKPLFERTIDVIAQNFVYSSRSPEFFRGCYVNSSPSESTLDVDHHSGLLVEGLSYFSNVDWALANETFVNVTTSLARCTLRQQITSNNYEKWAVGKDKIGGIRLSPSQPMIRIDVLGHLGVGITQLARNRELIGLVEREDAPR